MTKISSLPFAIALAFVAVGCVPPPVGVAVQTVNTSTPGVRYVIVHPNAGGEKGIAKDAEGKRIGGNAEYLLYCDGRSPDGMTCTLVPEVGQKRASNAAVPTKPGKKVDEAVGVLGTATITEVDKDKDKDKRPLTVPSVSSATSATSSAPSAPLPPTSPPAVTPPPPEPPPPPPPPPSRQKGKK